jgi:hypothetical protein
MDSRRALSVAQVKLLPNAVAVVLDGLHAKVQLLGDLRSVQALADQTKDLQPKFGG